MIAASLADFINLLTLIARDQYAPGQRDDFFLVLNIELNLYKLQNDESETYSSLTGYERVEWGYGGSSF